jgi:hypothetical protein
VTAGPKTLSHRNNNGLQTKNQAAGTDPADGVTKQQLDDAEARAKALENATGSLSPDSVSGFDTRVRTSRLDQMSAPTTPVQLNSQRLEAVGPATADGHAATWGQVKDLLSGARKTDVRLVATAQRALTGLAAIDGVTPVAGDRILLTGQTAAAENGIYTAASGAWARAADADQASEFATQWLVTAAQGNVNADTLWQHATDGVVTLGTTSLAFTKLGPISTATETGVSATCPATSAGAAWAWSHGLGTRLVLWQMFRTASPFDEVDCYAERTDTNTLTFKPDVAMAAGEYTVVARKAVV